MSRSNGSMHLSELVEELNQAIKEAKEEGLIANVEIEEYLSETSNRIRTIKLSSIKVTSANQIREFKPSQE